MSNIFHEKPLSNKNSFEHGFSTVQILLLLSFITIAVNLTATLFRNSGRAAFDAKIYSSFDNALRVAQGNADFCYSGAKAMGLTALNPQTMLNEAGRNTFGIVVTYDSMLKEFTFSPPPSTPQASAIFGIEANDHSGVVVYTGFPEGLNGGTTLSFLPQKIYFRLVYAQVDGEKGLKAQVKQAPSTSMTTRLSLISKTNWVDVTMLYFKTNLLAKTYFTTGTCTARGFDAIQLTSSPQSPTASPTPGGSGTPIPTATPSPSATAIPTVTPSPTATAIPTVTPTPTATAMATVAPTPTTSSSASPTPTPTASSSASPTPTPTASSIALPTPTPTTSSSALPTPTPTTSSSASPGPSSSILLESEEM